MKPKYDMPKWEFVRRRIKPLFVKAGIFSCELKYRDCDCKKDCKGCTGSFNLTFAHSMKRLSIENNRKKEYMEEVILACQHCHNLIENKGEAKMLPIVRNTIMQRIIPVESIFKRHGKQIRQIN